MNIVLWPVHRSWTAAFVQGRHRYLMPRPADNGTSNGELSQAHRWPSSVVQISPRQLAGEQVDAVVLQRPEEFGLAAAWLRRVPGRDVPAVYVEHDLPLGPVTSHRHPTADRDDLTLVHVTHFNALTWDAGRTRTLVVEPGVLDPGHRYSGFLTAAASVMEEPMRRPRTLGVDLLGRLASAVPLHVFGSGTATLAEHLGSAVLGFGPVPRDRLHTELARRRVFLHLARWMSLDHSLIEAMHLGMPVVVLGTTEAVEAIPPSAGVCSTSPDRLARALSELVADPELARRRGRAARRHALSRYGLHQFLGRWEQVLGELVSRRGPRPVAFGAGIHR